MLEASGCLSFSSFFIHFYLSQEGCPCPSECQNHKPHVLTGLVLDRKLV